MKTTQAQANQQEALVQVDIKELIALHSDPAPEERPGPPDGATPDPVESGLPPEGDDGRGSSTFEGATGTVVGVAGGEVARRLVKDAMDRKAVVDTARRVASKQTRGLSDAQVIEWLAAKPGRIKSLSGHLHEVLDAADLKQIDKLGRKLGLSPGRVLELYEAHNRPGLDGFYRGASEKGGAKFAQHKLSNSPQQLRKAADKVHPRLAGKTELVVGRGTKVDASTASRMKSVREAGRSVGDVRKIVEKAADPSKVNQVGAEAARKATAKAGGAAAGVAVVLTAALAANKVRKGELSVAEAAENAAWAGGEAATSTVLAAGATAAAAPTIAAGTAALAGSSLAGTTVMAAGLATLGPIGVGVGVGIGVGYGVKKIRKHTRGK